MSFRKTHWKMSDGKYIPLTKMDTNHLKNSVKLVNRMVHKNGYEYPECYDGMIVELEKRGVDTDFEFDKIYLGLDEEGNTYD